MSKTLRHLMTSARPIAQSAAVPSAAVLAAAVLAAVAAVCCVLASCSKPGATAKSPEAQPLTVSVAPIEIKALKGGVSASGLLTPKLEASVSTELNGYRVAQVFVDQGAHVKAGQPLAQLDDTLLKSQIAQQRAIVAQQEVASERAAAEAQRVAGLDNTGVLPQEQILERRLASRSGEAAVKAAQAQLADLMVRESLMTVRAPVGGLVLARMARPGDIAAPANAMFRIAADGVLELNAETPESELGRLHPGDAAEVTLPDGAVVTGHIRVVSPEVDAQTKLAGVRITLPVRADLRSGGYGRATFVDSSRPAMVAPENAVRFDADGASVLVLQADDRVRRVSVHTGVRSHGEVELLDGPAPGDKVLLGGGAFVLDGDKVHPVDARPGALTPPASGASGRGAS
jgi:HlyD family secretion protein